MPASLRTILESNLAVVACGAINHQVTREELEKVDMEIPTAFAKACKSAGCVRHISLLGSVGANANAKPSFLTGTTAGGGLYLSTKG
ncbi:unnamed protein product, partial [Hapterophycus canaliculatus]